MPVLRNSMEVFLNTVAEQIRWKRAKVVVLRELKDHMEDRYEAKLSQGLEETAAEAEAVSHMGDPVEIGRTLDAVHRPQSTRFLFLPVVSFLVISMCFWLFAFFDRDEPAHWIWLPLGCAAVGLSGMSLLRFLNWNHIMKHLWKIALPVWFGVTAAMAIFYPGMSGRWGEYCALMTPVFYASVLCSVRRRGLKGLIFCTAVQGVLLWVLSNVMYSFFGVICLFVTSLVMNLYLACSGWFGKKLPAVVLTLSVYMGFGFWQLGQILNDLFTQRLFLSGYGQLYRQFLLHADLIGPGEAFEAVVFDTTMHLSAASVQHFPITSEGDFFFGCVVYQLGWIPAMALLAALGGFLLYCLYKGAKHPAVWGKLLTMAVIIPMLLQTLANVCNNLWCYTFSSQLPLLSYGNTHRLEDLILLGLVASVFRSSTILRDDA